MKKDIIWILATSPWISAVKECMGDHLSLLTLHQIGNQAQDQATYMAESCSRLLHSQKMSRKEGRTSRSSQSVTVTVRRRDVIFSLQMEPEMNYYCLVISPLKALIADQVKTFGDQGLSRVGLLPKEEMPDGDLVQPHNLQPRSSTGRW
ncbi:hypothetical protein CAPTEDRAFT_193855 [Capitella teleta]|uniref:Uncharacterized protein n=1 Tax=Capitella teleta TaxID=283909 RepID=R7V518_CAPTE|nr:hypothetical protein CAPTEDRAFT_193855 [Capitella teleta]|eukprot:ELU11451.1 hypothetical protein CAPTEDRAFT_193855 [Capitella teleta]